MSRDCFFPGKKTLYEGTKTGEMTYCSHCFFFQLCLRWKTGLCVCVCVCGGGGGGGCKWLSSLAATMHWISRGSLPVLINPW